MSTLLLGSATASAQQAVFIPASPFPVVLTNNADCAFLGTCALINTIGIGAFIDFTNTGDFAVAGPGALGISTNTAALFGSIDVNNSGNIATAGAGAIGISANTLGPVSPIHIINSGGIATAGFGAIGIEAATVSSRSPIEIVNNGDIATAGAGAIGIYGYTAGRGSDLSITNNGGIATAAQDAEGINGLTTGRNSDLWIVNNGDMLTEGLRSEGVYATTTGQNAKLTVINSGTITTKGRFSEGIDAFTYGQNGDLLIVNSGDITTKARLSEGIFAGTVLGNSSLNVQNSGRVRAEGTLGIGIAAVSFGPSSPIAIDNSGEVYGSTVGIYGGSNTSTKIVNRGDISAGSNLAIDTVGAGSSIYNRGTITGFVDLTNNRDIFVNQGGGLFDAKETSEFGGGNDVFTNEANATLRTATKRSQGEFTRFVGLERFNNRGTITMEDGKANDVFRISNTVGGTDLAFAASGDSTLAVDTFLAGPNSPSDHFIIEGDVTGRTLVHVHNTNPGAARLDTKGIPVVFVDGDVKRNAFHLAHPIDTGFFDYDLFFRPTGSGIFELKNHPGGGAHILPHLVTVTHDTFHNTSETWFDQSTDLRVLLAQGSVCSDPARGHDTVRCEQLYNFTPGVWVRGAGTWLDLEDDAKTTARGRTYHYNLDRDLDIWTVESGIDFGKRDLFADGDILVFGVLGGAIESALTYKSLARAFELGGGEAGAYATYLNGGLFVDTLAKAFFAKLDPRDVRGFPDKLDSTTYGVRTDAGYRFGGMRYGPFFEPLATIAVSWSDIDDFVLDGNAINFGDDENVRGRVGLRLGTSSDIWQGTTIEPFIVGSLWGTLSGSHHATLTSSGTTFRFTDEPEEVWGVVSAGVNFFNPGAQTAVFAKVDYTFADQTEGIGVRGGMRYSW
ncbi:MAG: hypothetical protein ACRECX_03225 [Methyloceanibacter sp.]|uniref:hypothetical protein n=1 Tax=Methyloceanibacter sp. TaxID=1965321 RepID=UPI003D6CB5F5